MHTHTGDGVSASDNSSQTAEVTQLPPRPLKVSDRPAAGETIASQPITDLPVFV